MAREKQLTYQHHRVYLKPTGPEKVGRLPSSLDVPAYKHLVHDPLQSKVIERPAQGHNELTDSNVFVDQAAE